MKLVLVTILFLIFFINIGNFLDVTKSPEKLDVIVSLGIGADRTAVGVDLLKKSYASSNKYYFVGIKMIFDIHMKEKNIDSSMISDNIIYINHMKNTMDEINYIDKNIATMYDNIIIITDPPHSLRVDFMIKQFTKNLKGKYIIVSSEPTWWDSQYYFLNQKAIVFSMQEITKIFYNYFKYTFYF